MRVLHLFRSVLSASPSRVFYLFGGCDFNRAARLVKEKRDRAKLNYAEGGG
jgi:hypothetical protein